MIGNLLTLLGTGISSFFGFKGKQADVITKSMEVINDVNATSQARDVAAARILVAEAQSESWLTRSWRPLVLMLFIGLIISYWFGVYPPLIAEPMPPVIAEIFEIVKIAIMGYIPSRGLEKIVDKFKLGNVLQKFIEKKLG